MNFSVLGKMQRRHATSRYASLAHTFIRLRRCAAHSMQRTRTRERALKPHSLKLTISVCVYVKYYAVRKGTNLVLYKKKSARGSKIENSDASGSVASLHCTTASDGALRARAARCSWSTVALTLQVQTLGRTLHELSAQIERRISRVRCQSETLKD